MSWSEQLFLLRFSNTLSILFFWLANGLKWHMKGKQNWKLMSARLNKGNVGCSCALIRTDPQTVIVQTVHSSSAASFYSRSVACSSREALIRLYVYLLPIQWVNDWWKAGPNFVLYCLLFALCVRVNIQTRLFLHPLLFFFLSFGCLVKCKLDWLLLAWSIRYFADCLLACKWDFMEHLPWLKSTARRHPGRRNRNFQS